ncbi:uncharacterized protein N7496_006163 [Penicillium cataractarum]|uniref:Uncharacterized protein n=1 Tax=Penicillium cataractarum TaxID=2100454 RepID=A0A9W9S183_9EURO|nr:uncharacterized protein N7496_006163 [Penicillium cataractarum]KAJ5370071.1 hypothetical protein N7496_006163 [Penicillium cataractarum]
MCSLSSSVEWILENLGARNALQSYRWPLRTQEEEIALSDIVLTEYKLSKLAQGEKVIQENMRNLQNRTDPEKETTSLEPLLNEELHGIDQKY